MRIDRLLTLELGTTPGQGARGGGAPVKGRLSLGDRPDWIIDVSVRRAIDPFSDELLARAEELLQNPVVGIAPVVDLGRIGIEAYTAYRWVEGRSLAELIEAGISRAEIDRVLGAVRDILGKAKAVLSPEHGAPGLAPEQIFVLSDRSVVITDWLGGGRADAKLDPDPLVRALADRAHAINGFQLGDKTEATATQPTGVSFDSALGAALSGEAMDTEVDRKAAPRPATQALPRAHAPVDPEIRPVDTGTTERRVAADLDAEPSAATPEVPRGRVGSTVWVSLLVGALAIGGGVAIRLWRQNTPTPTPIATPVATPIATPSPTPIATLAPTPIATPTATPTPTPRPTPRPTPTLREPGPAMLSVHTDVAAGITVDGRYVGEAPLARYQLAAGTHTLHVEALEGTMRLLPRDETVTVAAGEKRALTIELK